jgi:hypothetical protein
MAKKCLSPWTGKPGLGKQYPQSPLGAWLNILLGFSGYEIKDYLGN